jgi:hypothetical protein
MDYISTIKIFMNFLAFLGRFQIWDISSTQDTPMLQVYFMKLSSIHPSI